MKVAFIPETIARPRYLRVAAFTLQHIAVLFRFAFATLLLPVNAAFATPINVLWYTYADPASYYVSFYSSLSGSGAGSAASYPESGGLAWNVNFFGPSSPTPAFTNYDVLVIHSGEAWFTGASA